MNFKKSFVVAVVVAGLGGAGYYWTHKSVQIEIPMVQGFDIRPLDLARDTEFIKEQNKQNWYLLHAAPEYDVDFMLQKNSPYPHEPRFYNKLTTVVLFENNKHIGFVNYYMKGIHEGTVFLLSVDKEHRGKGYGDALLRCAIEGLRRQGAQYIKLSVRVDNEPAQKLYKRLGFKVETTQDGFYFYRLDL